MTCLPRSFFERSTLQVARELLGCRLVRIENGSRLAGIILETEAYRGEEDQGCHAKAGKTPRTAIMYGPSGHAYVYFTYGMHWLLNVVTEAEGFPAAGLIRAILPQEGATEMAGHRPSLAYTAHWTDGPAKLTQALGVDGRLNGHDLCDPQGELFIEETGLSYPDGEILFGPRVGLFSVPEPWKSIPWRFRVKSDSTK
jgi:DNA-3-methyladenine glycosylase